MSADEAMLDAPKKETKPRALAELKFNNLLDHDQATTSEDEAAETQKLPVEEAAGAVGISIGREQSRLTSPKTTAVEKAAAIEEAGGFFGDIHDIVEPEMVQPEDVVQNVRREETNATTTAAEGKGDVSWGFQPQPSKMPERSPRKTEVHMPSPWRAPQFEPRKRSRSKSLLREGLLFSRKRASSGPESMLSSLHKSLLSSIPSMPKHWLPSSPFANLKLETEEEQNARASKPANFQLPVFGDDSRQKNPLQHVDHSARRNDMDGQVSSNPTEETDGYDGETRSRPQLQHVRSRPLYLQRSASDNSLIPQRTLSRVSSLGDDTRFENVQEQVNSRLKAIKDSWQDTSFRIPSVASIANYRPDFLRERSSSIYWKAGTQGAPPETTGNKQPEKPQDPITMQPYASTKAAVLDTTATKPAMTHPNFNRALEQLEGDVIILGGYRGSILRSAEPPHRQLWVPIKVGLNLRKVDLEVGLHEDSDEKATEKIIPGGMLTHIGPVDLSRRLFKRLRASDNAQNGQLRVHDYGYDWRLHPNHLSNQLIEFLEGLPSNHAGVDRENRGAIVIAHSLGGLITRHAVNQRPDLFKGVIYAGVPMTCVNILGPMRNGDEVLLSSRVLTAQVNFTVRTSYALLPLDGRCFFDKYTREEYPVDFFDPQAWIEHRLSPCVARPLPPLSIQAKPSGISGYVSSVTSALPSLPLPGRKGSLTRSKNPIDPSNATTAGDIAAPEMHLNGVVEDGDDALTDGNIDASGKGKAPIADIATTVRTAVTIPKEEAIAFLTRTLATVKKFKQELAFTPSHAANNAYPPISVIYGKSTPTVYGAKVNGREGIRHADAYDELAFASGDGVVLARAAMVPDGYTTVRGGVVSSERGHVTLLGDLEAVGRCLNAMMEARNRGVGLGAA